MARPRNFDEAEVLRLARGLFSKLGYNATSIDDLVRTTGLQRGSLYAAFGSKRNLFEKVLSETSEGWEHNADSLDLVIVTLKELAPIDSSLRELCRKLIAGADTNVAQVLGARLLSHLKE